MNPDRKTMKKWMWAPALAMVLVTAGCATLPPYDPFQVPKKELYAKITTIALIPLIIPKWAGKSDAVQEKMEALITAKLEDTGFVVIPSQEYAKIWNRMLDQMGGIYDPFTGKLDKPKCDMMRDYARREMATNFRIDGLLYPGIQTVEASVEGSKATWDGTSESILLSEEWYGSYTGTISAASLAIALEDVNGVELYLNRGGIRILTKVYFGRFYSLKPSEVMKDEEKNAQAVEIALKPLSSDSVPGDKSPGVRR